MDTKKFQRIIKEYYRNNKRNLPWRTTKDPYKIHVSEVMLQQTQVSRVIPKYLSFVKNFPTTQALSEAKLADILVEWQGLGYARRAIFLKQCAEKVSKEYGGKFPKDLKTLCSLPGIGPATAGDIMAFAWNIPVTVIETNIRSVFIHFFFPNKRKVTDKEIIPLIERSLDKKNPREWYWALFDYGSFLKKTGNPSVRSAHYTKQTPFKGSYRQKRSRIIKILLEKSRTERKIQEISQYEKSLVSKILLDLQKSQFIRKTASNLYIIA